MEIIIFLFLLVGVPLIIRFSRYMNKIKKQKQRDKDLHDIAEYYRNHKQ